MGGFYTGWLKGNGDDMGYGAIIGGDTGLISRNSDTRQRRKETPLATVAGYMISDVFNEAFLLSIHIFDISNNAPILAYDNLCLTA